MEEVKIVGKMDNTIDHTFESANRVYDKNGLCPTIPTCAGGNIQPKVIEETKCVGGLTDSLWGGKQHHQQDRVYKGDIALAEPANIPGGSYKYIVAMRGRGEDNEQQLEPNTQGVDNALTTVQKDNLVMEKNCVIDIYNNKKIDGEVCGTITAHGNASSTSCGTFGIVEKEKINKVGQISNEGIRYVETIYRIRKLTPRECWRLMGYTDEDFEKAAEVNSNTQLYKQAGNAIVKQVLMAIFEKMIK